MSALWKKSLFFAVGAAALFLLRPAAAEAQTKTVPSDVRDAMTKAGISAAVKPIPIQDFTVSMLDGRKQSLAGLKGKVVFLNFWATWCPPCRAEMPSMETLYKKYQNKGFEMFTVNQQETRDEAAAFMKKLALSFPVGLDTDGKAGGKYGVRAIPTTYLIDRNGFIVGRVEGSIEWDTQEVFAAVDKLLAMK